VKWLVVGAGGMVGRDLCAALASRGEEIVALARADLDVTDARLIDAAVAHSTAQGWSHDDYVRLGAAWVVRSHQIKYLQSAYAGEAVVVRTWVASMKRFSSVRKYRIIRRSDETLLASAETEWVLVNLETRALAPIPPQLTSSFTIVET